MKELQQDVCELIDNLLLPQTWSSDSLFCSHVCSQNIHSVPRDTYLLHMRSCPERLGGEEIVCGFDELKRDQNAGEDVMVECVQFKYNCTVGCNFGTNFPSQLDRHVATEKDMKRYK